MTAPFDDNENTRIAQPDTPDYSSFEGPWNEDFESTYHINFFFGILYWVFKKWFDNLQTTYVIMNVKTVRHCYCS